MMKISVIGSGYVGLVTGACFAETEHNVWCVDVDEEKIRRLKGGIMPIYEPKLEETVIRNYKLERLHFTTDINLALKETDICFIAVGTPMGEDGGVDLHYVKKVAQNIGKGMIHHMYVVDKSTVPVGTAELVRKTIQAELDNRELNLTFDVISNPEFLKEGTAVRNCMNPDRVIVGVDNEKAADVMRDLYHSYINQSEDFLVMDIASAEMTKYAANAMLATRISFMNEISNICERVGADVNKVRMGIGSDSRIGHSFIYPGCGYGGSCFPKDVQALIRTGREYGYEPTILQAVENVNYEQKRVIPHKVIQKFGEDLRCRRFAVWGLAFKPDTNDMRESAAITIINELTTHGASIIAYDPKAMKEAQEHYLKGNIKVSYAKDQYEALTGADALILVTEWNEFKQPDYDKICSMLKTPVIFDGRNQFEREMLAMKGIEYWQIGVK